jgi:hypothetical protein
MGFVRKVTGVQAQIDATNANADAQTKATAQAAAADQQQLMQSAKATADQQAQIAARSAAESKASSAVSAPLEQADVQLAGDGADAQRRSRKASFGRNYSSGVSI